MEVTENWAGPGNEAKTGVVEVASFWPVLPSRNLNSFLSQHFRLPLMGRTYLGTPTFPRASKPALKVRRSTHSIGSKLQRLKRIYQSTLVAIFFSTAVDRLVRWKWFNIVMCKCTLHLS